jgi:hypothetical protein
MNFKIIEGTDFISPAAEICAGLADNFCQEFVFNKKTPKYLFNKHRQ